MANPPPYPPHPHGQPSQGPPGPGPQPGRPQPPHAAPPPQPNPSPQPPSPPKSNGVVRIGGAGLALGALVLFAALPFAPWQVPEDDRYVDAGEGRSWLDLLTSGHIENMLGPGLIALSGLFAVLVGVIALIIGRGGTGYLGFGVGLLAALGAGSAGVGSFYFAVINLEYGVDHVLFGTWGLLIAAPVLAASCVMCLVGGLKTRRPKAHRGRPA